MLPERCPYFLLKVLILDLIIKRIYSPSPHSNSENSFPYILKRQQSSERILYLSLSLPL